MYVHVHTYIQIYTDDRQTDIHVHVHHTYMYIVYIMYKYTHTIHTCIVHLRSPCTHTSAISARTRKCWVISRASTLSRVLLFMRGIARDRAYTRVRLCSAYSYKQLCVDSYSCIYPFRQTYIPALVLHRVRLDNNYILPHLYFFVHKVPQK